MIKIEKILLLPLFFLAAPWSLIQAAQAAEAPNEAALLERTRIRNNILEPLAAHLKLPVSIYWQADNHPNNQIAAYPVNGINQLLVHPLFASSKYSDEERVGLAGHEDCHFVYEHGEKARQRTKKLGYAFAASPFIPSIPHILKGQFPKNPIRNGLLSLGAAAVVGAAYVQSKERQDETEADVGTVHLFPPHFRVPEGLIESFKKQQQRNLAYREEDIKDIMARDDLPSWRKRRQIAAHPIDDSGDDRFDVDHPTLSDRIKRVQQELLKRDNPKEYNRQRQAQKEAEIRSYLTV